MCKDWIVSDFVKVRTGKAGADVACRTCTSSMYTMTLDQIMPEFGSSHIVVTLGLSLFIWGLGMLRFTGWTRMQRADLWLKVLDLYSWVRCLRLVALILTEFYGSRSHSLVLRPTIYLHCFFQLLFDLVDSLCGGQEH